MDSAPPARLADRRRLLLTLGAPYALLLLASLVEWPWRALGAPTVAGSLSPPGFVLLAFAVGASTYALRRKLPLSMITWLPAGQGAIVLLATGFFAGGAQDQLTGLAFIAAYGFIFLIVLAIATAIASNGAPVAIAFVAFFALTQAARFPIFGADGGGAEVANAGLLTLAAFLRAAVELAVLAWLARRLVEAADSSAMPTALWIVALTLGHGALAGWEDPALRGALTLSEYVEQVARWLMLACIQLGMAAVLIRFRRAQHRDQEAQPQQPADPEPERSDAADAPAPTSPRAGRPTPRRRRRR